MDLRDEKTKKPVCLKCWDIIERDNFAGVVSVEEGIESGFYHTDCLPTWDIPLRDDAE